MLSIRPSRRSSDGGVYDPPTMNSPSPGPAALADSVVMRTQVMSRCSGKETLPAPFASNMKLVV